MRTLREAFRTLARTPGFAATAVGSVGIAIGLAGSVFTVIMAAFFGELPYPDADRLLELWQTERPGASSPQDYIQPTRMLAFAESRPRYLESITGTGLGPSLTLRRGNESETVDAAPVVGDWFATMGVDAARGRLLTPEDARPGAERAAVISARFAREHSVDLGSALDLSGAAYTVVGVMPTAFEESSKVWVPLESLPAGLMSGAFAAVARLRVGATVQEGALEIEQMAAAQVAADSSRFGRVGATALPYGAMARGPNKPGLWMLAGVVGAVLLIGISNLTQLVLVRAQARSRSLALRAALGGSAWQIGRGLAAEGFIIGAAGGVLGVLLTVWGKDVVRAFLARGVVLPSPPTVGPGVVLFALSLGVLVALMVGLEPLRRAGSLDLQSVLQRRVAASVSTPAERRTQRFMVAAQVAISVVLVAVAGVLGSAYRALTHLDMGYDADRVVEARPAYDVAGMGVAEQWSLIGEVAERLARHPAVSGVAAWEKIGEDYPPKPDFDVVLDVAAAELDRVDKLGWYYLVRPGTLEALGIDLVSGRALSDADDASRPLVGLLTRGAAETWWPGDNPLGHRLQLGRNGPWVTVVGVVEDVQPFDELGRTFAMTDRHLPFLFIPAAQLPTPPVGWREFGCCDGVMIAVRPRESTAAAGHALRNELAATAPSLALESLGTMLSLQVGEGYSGRTIRLTGRLVGSGVVVALALALLGILGVVREGLARRTREIGLRIALGARAGDIVLDAARDSVVTALRGIALGLAIVIPLSAVLSARVFGYDVQRLTDGVLDPPVLAAATVVVALASSLTATLASARAASVDPAVTLRAE